MDYMLQRWDGFTRFLDDGRICLTNNAAERALRPLALGRKSWLFAGSDRGGERAAAMYTLIGTAKLNDVDPQAWLVDVLGRIAALPHTRVRAVALELEGRLGPDPRRIGLLSPHAVSPNSPDIRGSGPLVPRYSPEGYFLLVQRTKHSPCYLFDRIEFRQHLTMKNTNFACSSNECVVTGRKDTSAFCSSSRASISGYSPRSIASCIRASIRLYSSTLSSVTKFGGIYRGIRCERACLNYVRYSHHDPTSDK